MSKLQRLLPGLILIAFLSFASLAIAQYSDLGQLGIGPLTAAIIMGGVLGNFLPAVSHERYQPGLKFTQSHLLRLGVGLYGLNLSIQQVIEVGIRGILIDVLMVTTTLFFGCYIGIRFFRMDKETALLTAAGNAICGAAAIVATAPILKMPQDKSADATAVAVSTVVIFGSIAMLLYPVLYSLAGLSQTSFGVFVGSTVQEVAQVVAIGNMIGADTAHSAVIAKMIRVLMLIPFLFCLSFVFRKADKNYKFNIPWFAIAFLLLTMVNSLNLIPIMLKDGLRYIGLISLTAAMAALGLDTNLKRIRQAGLKAVGLGICLFAYLIVVGGFFNYWISG